MKNFILKGSLFFLAFVLVACQNDTSVNSDSFTVTGNIEGLDTEFMSRSYRDAEGNRLSDSIFVEDGKFTYTAKLSEPTFIVFWPNVEYTIKRTGRGYYPAKSSQFAFLASPGDQIEFKGKITDFVDAYPTGTSSNNDLASINSQIFPILNKSVNTQLRINELDETDPLVKILEDSIAILDEMVVEMKKEFITSNTNSEAAVWYLSDMMVRSQISQESAIKTFKSFNVDLKDYPFYKAVDLRVKGIESTMVGRLMPNFTTTNTMDGTTFELDELKGKHVLIDFWGTWCAPCIAEMPKVKEYQDKYKNELVVLGVNSGDTKDKIKQFVEKNGYNWKQILTGKGTEDLVLKLNVAGFPTKFILDPEGKIIQRFVGDTVEAFDKLDEILQ